VVPEAPQADVRQGLALGRNGTTRRTELNLGVPAHRIQTDLQSLLDDATYWRDNGVFDVIEQATRLHHRAVFIHPFLNGNGRSSKLEPPSSLGRKKRLAMKAWSGKSISRRFGGRMTGISDHSLISTENTQRPERESPQFDFRTFWQTAGTGCLPFPADS
jgi:hypothetical protein